MATGGSSTLSLCSELFYDFSCDPCAKEGRQVEAVKGCVDCHQNFCSQCLRDHNKFEGMRAHQILDRAGMLASGQQAPAFQPKEKCPVHPGKMIEMFCGAHDVVCCGVCIPIDHRICKGVDYIPNASKGIKTSQELKDVTDRINQVKLQLSKTKYNREEDLKRIQKEKTKCLNDIDHFHNDIVKHLDTLVKKAKDEVHNKTIEMGKAINAHIQNLQDMISTLEATVKNIVSCKDDNEAELFLYVKQGKSRMDGGSPLLQELLTSTSKEILQFDVNINITDFIMNLKSIGDIKNLENKQLIPGFQSQSNVKVRVTQPFNSATLHGDYNVKANDDKMTCDIMGCCLLEDGSVIISDDHNHKVKRLDQSYKVVDQCALSYPWGVCSTGPTEVAVALSSDRKIQLLSTAGQLKLTRSFQVGLSCHYVAFSNGELFVSGWGGVCVYSLTGNHLRTLQNDSAGSLIFRDPRQTSVSNFGTKIHVADGNNGVKFTDRQGQLQSTFTDPDLLYAWGVCVLENDNMLVSGTTSNNIIQIDNQGRKVQVLLSQEDGIQRPRVLCYDHDNSRLIVTMKDTDCIKVFNLIRK